MAISAGIRDANLTGPAAYTVQALNQYTPPFFDGKPLPVFGVRIVYTGPRCNRLGHADWASNRATNAQYANWVLRHEDLSAKRVDYKGHTVAEFSGDLSAGGPNGCGPGWNQLIKLLRDMQSASQILAIYVGFLPTGVPANVALGCGSIGVAAGFVSSPSTTAGILAQTTMAQEIGHAFGRDHAPSAVTAPNTDPNYPVYTTGPSGTIGEVGFDSETGQTLSPSLNTDFMSYSSPNWISPYTYESLRYISIFV